jgi:hypothetical protein
MSTGDGGGVAHAGFIWNGSMEHNTILFNQSLNPTIPANGGGIVVMGAPPDGNVPGTTIECGTTVDVDCVPGLSDGTGPGLVINANLIQGNSAESGAGGGLRFQAVNGTDVTRLPKNPSTWNSATVTNNIIANNIAGWDGAGISLEDALTVSIINNTIVSNDATATAGVLFNTLGAPLASSQAPPPTQTTSSTTSASQPAGLASTRHSAQLASGLAGLPAGTTVTCPAHHAGCTSFSNPYLANNVFWQNRSFYIGVGAFSPAFQQNVVLLFNAPKGTAAGSAVTNQATTGACVSGSTYWDLGVRGDTGPGNHTSTFQLAPIWSVLTSMSENGRGSNNIAGNPGFTTQYCNGSRVPPEFSKGSFNVPPGISDATVPNPVFNLTAAATVDEGNNWVNLTWGPLSLTHPVSGAQLSNYSLTSASRAIDHIPPTASSFAAAPRTDFFGNPRADRTERNIDAGAVEFQDGSAILARLISILPAADPHGTTVAVTLSGSGLTGATNVIVSGTGITVSNFSVVNSTTVRATFHIAATAARTARSVSVVTPSGTIGGLTFTVN